MRKLFPFVLLISVVAIIALTFTRQQPRTIKNRASESQIAQLTNQLLKVNNTRSLRDDQKIQQLTAIAIQRKQLLLDEARKDPQAFLGHVLSKDQIESLSRELRDQKLIEEEQVVSGNLITTHRDDFEKKVAIYEHYLETQEIENGKKKTYMVYTSQKQTSQLPPVKAVAIQGYTLNSTLVTNQLTGGPMLTPSPTPTPFPRKTTGEIKIAVILVNFSNDTSQPFTHEQVQQAFFGETESLKSYYRENSYNQLNYTGDIFGYYTIPFSNENCLEDHQWGESASETALNAGVVLERYDIISYVLNTETGIQFCISRVGGEHWNKVYLHGTILLRTLVHEFGHTLGLYHANSRSCGSKYIDEYHLCTENEYGDVSDVMGYGFYISPLPQFKAKQKVFERWIPESRIQTITQSGTYTVNRVQPDSTAAQALRILKSEDREELFLLPEYYFIEYKQKVGLDSSLPDGLVSGALIYTHQQGFFNSDGYYHSRSDLLDTHLLETSYTSFDDAALSDNGIFYDHLNNILITQLSHNNESATLRIDFNPSVTPTFYPTFTPSPTIPKPSLSVVLCPKQSIGDIDCDGRVTLTDFEIWRFGYFEEDNR